jgi:dTDP-4-amino-4,6-dideoxygalactose transaminase
MIVNYIEKKETNWNKVKEYLSLSETVNQFTNNGPVKSHLEEQVLSLIRVEKTFKTISKVLCVNNGTSACNMVMHHCENKKGGKIKWLSDNYTFPSILTGGFDVKLCDYGDTLETLKKDKKINGIILTYLFGATPVNFKEIIDLCKEKRIYVVLDIASSPIVSQMEMIGDGMSYYFGSFHHTKNLGFGEGGFIICDKEEYDSLLKISNFGFDIDRNYSLPSNNYKMSDISAAFILQRINKGDDIIMHTQYNFRRFIEKIQDNEHVQIFGCERENGNIMYGNIPLLFKRKVSTSEFRDLGIEANKYYKPLSKTPKSADLYDRIINLPLYPSLTDYQIYYMAEITNKLANR